MKIRVIANAHSFGGGELSVCTIMRLLVEDGHEVEFHPTAGLNPKLPMPSSVKRGPKFAAINQADCDVLFFYANNFIYKIRKFKDHWRRLFGGAARRVMCLNFDISQAADPWFRKAWQMVLFLNTTKRRQFPADGIPTASLAPAVELEPYLSIRPDYSRINLIRHSKRFKHCDDEVRVTCRVRDLVPEAHFWFMSPPPGIARKYPNHPNFHLFPAFAMPVEEFLSHGSVFWYRLGRRMRDQGPRVIVEAMAAGLPPIVDDRDGAKDRVTAQSGWKCSGNDDYVRVVQEIGKDISVLAEKGANARRRAVEHFDPRRWVEPIVGA